MMVASRRWTTVCSSWQWSWWRWGLSSRPSGLQSCSASLKSCWTLAAAHVPAQSKVELWWEEIFWCLETVKEPHGWETWGRQQRQCPSRRRSLRWGRRGSNEHRVGRVADHNLDEDSYSYVKLPLPFFCHQYNFSIIISLFSVICQ